MVSSKNTAWRHFRYRGRATKGTGPIPALEQHSLKMAWTKVVLQVVQTNACLINDVIRGWTNRKRERSPCPSEACHGLGFGV